MNRKRWELISILLGVALVSCLAGCDGKDDGKSKTDQGTIPISRTIQISPNMPASRAGHYISDIPVTLTDPHGSPLQGKKVELVVSPEVVNMDGTKLTNDTQGNGVASLKVDAKVPELSAQLKVDGKVVEKELKIRHAVITPPSTDQPKPSKATVQLGPKSRLENASMLALLEARVTDRAGTALANVPITLTSSNRNDVISPSIVHTNQGGLALFSLTYQESGKRRITVLWNGTQLGAREVDLEMIEVGSPPPPPQPPPPSTASVQLTDKTSFLADGRLLALLEVTVRDRAGVVLANVPITLVSDRNDAVSPAIAHTNQQGQALCSLIYEPPGQRVITVMWNQTPLGREPIPLPAMGQLLVTSQPGGAEVVLGGKSRGVTPQRLDLPFGKHQITLKKRGYKSLEGQQIEVKAVWPSPLSFELQSLKITGSVVFDEPQDPPVAGAVVHIEGTPYQTVTTETGEFVFSDWVKGELPQTCTLRLEDSQNRFEPESVPNIPIGEFDQDITLKNPVKVIKRTTKPTFFLQVLGIEVAGQKRPLPDAAVFINGTKVEDDNKDGIFQTAVASSTDRVPIRVQQECYETPQGVDVYEDALQIPPNAQNYFVSISLFPKLFFVELPTDWEIPQKPGIGFVAKRSPQDKGGEIGILDGRRVIFHCAPFLIEGRRVSVQMMQNTMSLGPARGLEVKKYKRI